MSLKSKHFPIFIVLSLSLLIGIFTFQDYGMTWDEYLYYQYADSIGYAYSIEARVDGNFDLSLAFEPSAWDHQNHGPAYLLVARNPVYFLEWLTGIDKVALWHLLNFINFLIGVFFLYYLSLRWFRPAVAISLSLFYLSQPVLWGHAFINPKDSPFTTVFIASIYFGLKMVDKLALHRSNDFSRQKGISTRAKVFWHFHAIQNDAETCPPQSPSRSTPFGANAKSMEFGGKNLAPPLNLTVLSSHLGDAKQFLYQMPEWAEGASFAKLFMIGYLKPLLRGKSIPWFEIFATGILIGVATNLRIIGPLLGVMIFGYALLKKNAKILLWFIPTGMVALLVTYISWPYLWHSPIATFIEVLETMAKYPVSPKIFFYGRAYRSYEVPLRYLPVLLGITLTEPVWILFTAGISSAIFKVFKKKLAWQDLSIIIFWFGFMLAYVLIMRPPMYDNYRHFLFILPPVFIISGFAIEEIYKKLSQNWLKISFLVFILAFGVSGSLKLHPYEYTYYNSIVGGTGNAEGKFATDYWLTCYKDAAEAFNEKFPDGETLMVYREPQNLAYYTAENIEVLNFHNPNAGKYLLLSARINEVNTILQKYPTILTVGRDGATFCRIIKIEE